MNKISDYLATSSTIIMTQPLSGGVYIKETYEKMAPAPHVWKIIFSSNSAHNICPFDGNFRKCTDCNGIKETEDTYCLSKQQFISTEALKNRIVLYLRNGGELEYY